MPLSEKKRISNNRYLASMKTIALRMKPGEHGEMKEAAQAAGQSLQGFILQACRERMERESTAVPRAEPVSSAGAAQECGAVSIPSDALEAVRVAAEAAGMTVDAWIVQAIKDKL